MNPSFLNSPKWPLCPPERQKLKRLATPNAKDPVAKDMEQLEPSNMAGGSMR